MSAYDSLLTSLKDAAAGVRTAADAVERLRIVQDRNTAALQQLARTADEVARRLSRRPARDAELAAKAVAAARRAEWHMNAIHLCFRPGHIRKRPRLLRSLGQVLLAQDELRACLRELTAERPEEAARASAIAATLDRTDLALAEVAQQAPGLICVVRAGE